MFIVTNKMDYSFILFNNTTLKLCVTIKNKQSLAFIKIIWNLILQIIPLLPRNHRDVIHQSIKWHVIF